MNIGLDFDDVVASTNEIKSEIARLLYGVEIEKTRFRREFVVATGILTEEQYLTVAREAYSGKHLVSPVSGSIEGVQRLRSDGHQVRIVTNRSNEFGTLSVALRWLKEHGISIEVKGIPYGSSKAPACKGLDLFVDDDPKKLHELVGIVPSLLFFCWPHNAHESEPDNSVRVHSWAEIHNYIQQLQRKRTS